MSGLVILCIMLAVVLVIVFHALMSTQEAHDELADVYATMTAEKEVLARQLETLTISAKQAVRAAEQLKHSLPTEEQEKTSGA